MTEKKALIVDDDALIRTLIGSFLEKEGWTFVSVDSGKDALELVDDFQPDVITLDYIMPEMTGIDVFKELKKRNANIPVVFLTISKEDKLIKEFLELGAFGYLTKPFRSPEIIFILTKAYQYKKLKGMISDFEKKDHDFNALYDAVSELGSKGIDHRLTQRVLIDRQKNYLMDQFLLYYKNRKNTLVETINSMEKLTNESCPGSKECEQAIQQFRDSILDINSMMEKTVDELDKITERINN